MAAIGWVIWGIVVFVAMGSLYWFLTQKRGIQAGTVSTIVNQWILVLWSFYFPQLNKVHLLWLTPLTYVLAMPATFVFAFIRSKWTILIVAMVINILILWVLT